MSDATDTIAADLHRLSDAVAAQAPELWGMALRQQRIDACNDLCFGLLLGIAIYFACRKVYAKDEDGDFVYEIELRAVLGIVLVVFTGIAGLILHGAIPQLLNPEYYAVCSLARLVRL